MELRIAEWAKALTFAILAFLLYSFLGFILRILFLFTAAAVLSFFMGPLIGMITRITKRRTAGILAAYLLLLLGFAGAIALIVPVIADQLRALAVNFPDYLAAARRSFESLDRYFGTTPFSDSALEPRNLLRQAGQELTKELRGVIGLIPTALNAVSSIGLIFIISLYLSLALPDIDNRIKSWLTSGRLIALYGRFKDYLSAQIGRYLGGVAQLMLAVGVMTAAGLWLIGIPNPLILGAIAGLFEVIPFFGPVLGAIPAVILALTVGTIPALLTVGLFILVQLIESNAIGPLVLGKTVEIHPLGVILLLITGEQLVGVIGAILAVPTYVLIKSLGRFLRSNFSYIRETEGPDRIVIKEERNAEKPSA